MRRSLATTVNTGLTLALMLFPPSSDAVLPALAALGQQIVHDTIIGGVKGHLIGSLSGMGCRGSHIAGLIAGADTSHGGMPMPGGMGGGASMRSERGGAGIINAPPGMPVNGAMDPAMMAQVMQQMGGNMPAMSPEQMASMRQAMSSMQDAMAHPLSRAETLGVFDELGELGLLTPAMKSEARDCITLAPPGSDAQIGMTGAMLKTTVLPQLRETRQRLANLTPDEQNQLAQGMIDALQNASPDDRKAFFDGMGLGFFPTPVAAKVKAAIGGK